MLMEVEQTEIQVISALALTFGFRLAALVRIGAMPTSTYAMFQAVAPLLRTLCLPLAPASTLRAVGFVQSYKLLNKKNMRVLINQKYYNQLSVIKW